MFLIKIRFVPKFIWFLKKKIKTFTINLFFNMRIISRLDIKNQNLIKGINLEGLKIVGEPNKFALKYYNEGIDEILFMDVVASLYGRNNLFDIISKASKDSEEVIAFKCITLWSMAHGLVGIIRKVKIAGNLNEDSIGPMSFAGEIANNLDAHLDKVVTGIIEN